MSELSVWSIGASSPLGLDARQTALFWRAGKADPRGTRFRDKTGVSVGAVRSANLSDDTVGYERMLALAIPALEEVLSAAPAQLRSEKTILLLSLPELYEGEDERIATRLLFDLAKAVNLSLDDRSAVVRLGRAGFAALLGRAQLYGDIRVIIGGVDSYYDAARMATLDTGFRLLSERSANGFIPGEAAAFVCVSPKLRKVPTEVRRLATITLVATGEQDLDGPPTAGCFTKLLRDPRLPHPIPWVLTDLNGERHRVKEWTYAAMRNPATIDPEKTIIQNVPRDFGDVGAASGALLLVIGTLGLTLGFGAGSSVAIVTASDGKERALIHLARNDE